MNKQMNTNSSSAKLSKYDSE